ncbi:MAG TPA: glycoside hydrolase family 9 protein [Verrucomicrobiales bacterium]|nr:glycoside hydrolase family 9 protein [Verrucomicrobiales bacterium]
MALTAAAARAEPLRKEDGPWGITDANPLSMPMPGAHGLRVLSPSVLELTLITTRKPDGEVEQWDFVTNEGKPRLPPPATFTVTADGVAHEVTAVGFKRRVLYAPLAKRDLRIGNYLYLELAKPVQEGTQVSVKTADASLWKAGTEYSAKASRLRWTPVIHVNQTGYEPSWPKVAMAGYYLGSTGELPVTATEFKLVKADDEKEVFTGVLKTRRDEGFEIAVKPYQKVMEADFSMFNVPGEYRLMIPGLGASYPFFIHEGVMAAVARTYALGLYHQRCGAANGLPFSRFAHAACHTAAAEVPTPEFKKVAKHLADMSSDWKKNPRHTAPQLKDVSASLYPFINQGKVDVSGGHHDAGDYSKYTINSAQFIHCLVFAADAFDGAGELDNLGVPESGDGKSDLLQIAKWEADFLTKMQDADGGFYFLVYPRERAYENNVLPDKGDPQVVFPKTTAVTAAAVAALAQTASSPRFKREFPADAARYLLVARKGWDFLQQAIAKHGRDGSYQKITHYGDTFMHDDELAWAATEMFFATGDESIHTQWVLKFDPSSREMKKWSWVRMFESCGCAIRSYAFAVKSGRVTMDKLNAAHLEKCHSEIQAQAADQIRWAAASAYGTSFPDVSKRFRTAGWYFSDDAVFDILTAGALKEDPAALSAILSNLNYEGGANPNNVTLLTGLGWKRQREIVHQYAMNDARVLPPSGIPLGNIQEGFMYLEHYKKELGALTFPPDGGNENPYPFYDRWADSFNVTTEFVAVNQARALAGAAALMARTPLKTQPWRSAAAAITGVPKTVSTNGPITARLSVEGLDVANARIVWEASGQQPVFGETFTFSPAAGAHWIEAEAQWPDGRRAFARVEFEAASVR